MKKLVMILVTAAMTAVCGDYAQAELDIPASGIFDIVINPPGTPGISFDSIPYTGSSMYLWPFATDDLYAGPGSDYNLATAAFSDGPISITDSGYPEFEGDLGIRIGNYVHGPQTFGACVLTLDFDDGDFDVYLPEFTFSEPMTNMFFWVAQSGATYYAHSSKDVGFPDLSAVHVMAAGDEYLARTPEPTTVMLFGLGALLLRRRRKAISN